MRFKARLYIQSDLQELVYRDIYTTTLAVRLFRVLIAIVTIFNLDCQQGNIINAFINSKINKVVYIKCLNRFGVKGKYILLLQALYGLRRSPLLQYNELTIILKKEGLRLIAEESCLYYNDWLIVFFYINNITVIYRKEDLPKLQSFKE